MSEGDILDLRGLKCPTPLIKTQVKLRALKQGMRLTVLVDDPQAYGDFLSLASVNLVNLLDCQDVDSHQVIHMERL